MVGTEVPTTVTSVLQSGRLAATEPGIRRLGIGADAA